MNINLDNKEIIVDEGTEYMVKMKIKTIDALYICASYALRSKLFTYLSVWGKWCAREVCKALVNSE